MSALDVDTLGDVIDTCLESALNSFLDCLGRSEEVRDALAAAFQQDLAALEAVPLPPGHSSSDRERAVLTVVVLRAVANAIEAGVVDLGFDSAGEA